MTEMARGEGGGLGTGSSWQGSDVKEALFMGVKRELQVRGADGRGAGEGGEGGGEGDGRDGAEEETEWAWDGNRDRYLCESLIKR